MWTNPFAELAGRHVLVTGASSGIGTAVAGAFADCGARVGVHCSAGVEAATALANAIGARGGSAVVVRSDLSVRGGGERMIAAMIEASGGLDVLVANAGGPLARRPFADIPAGQIDHDLQLNLTSTLEAMQAALRHFRGQGRGNIVNTSSVAARNGGAPGVSVYAAAKGGIEAITRAVAREYAPEGIRINCIAPGFISTPIHDRISSAEEKAAYLRNVPMGRGGTPDDCVGAFLFLACDRLSGYITGQTLAVNGGMHLV